jgi:hypothetical protein
VAENCYAAQRQNVCNCPCVLYMAIIWYDLYLNQEPGLLCRYSDGSTGWRAGLRLLAGVGFFSSPFPLDQPIQPLMQQVPGAIFTVVRRSR